MLTRNKLGVAIIASLYGSFGYAQIVTDGSMGDATTLSGPDYVINQNLGTLAGNNLFHSFQQFNILQNESAVFRGDSDINNVISRVTGGDASVIQGFLKSEVGDADFYFINPAGVMFGNDSKVDVPAAFHVSTAHQLEFANGDVFASSTTQNSTLSVASPASFGFLGAQSGNISFESADIKIDVESTASFTATNISVNDSRIKLDEGTLSFNAIGDQAATINISAPELVGNGTISFNNAEVKIEGENGGQLSMTAATIDSHYADLIVGNTGDVDSEIGIQMNANDVVLADSYVRTETTGSGKAGDIVIVADNFTLTSTSDEEENQSVLSSESKIFDELPDIVDDPDIPDIPGDDDDPDEPDEPDMPGPPGGPGDGGDPPPPPVTDTSNNETSEVNDDIGSSGDIFLNIAGQLTMSTNATISNVTQGNAQGGDINIKAGSLTIDSGEFNTEVGITTLTTGQGHAGNLNIQVDNDILLQGNGQINAMTLGEGDAGDINVTASNLIMEENEQTPRVTEQVGLQSLSGQESDLDNAPTGSSGDINLNLSGNLEMINGGNIVSITVGDGTAGDITINANNIHLSSDIGRASNVIGSNTLGPTATGDAGNIILKVTDTVELSGNAFVSTTASSKGNAGDMTINARRLLMNGNGNEESRSGINSATRGGDSTGNAGTVIVNVTEDIRMTNGANITSDTSNDGNAGNIFITANSLFMSANDDSADTGISSGASAELPVTGDAANIYINVAGAFEMRGEAELKTESESRGNAGSIFIEAGSFLMQGGELESKAEAEEGRFRAGDAGEVSIKVVGHFEMSDESGIASDSFRSGAAGNVTIEAGSMTLSEFSSISSTAALTPDNAGNVSITVTGEMSLVEGASIVSDSITAGQAGTININAQNLNLLGGGLPTRISSSSVNGRGNAGQINITVQDELRMLSGGQIASSSLGAEGNAGEVNVRASTLYIDADNNTSLDAWLEIISEEFDELPDRFDELPTDDDDLIELATIIDIQAGNRLNTGISSTSDFGARGDAGVINIEANNITVRNSGEINTSSRANGDAGDINILTDNLNLIQHGEGITAGIFSRVSDTGKGAAGTINIFADGTVKIARAQIAVDSSAQFSDEEEVSEIGSIIIAAQNLDMDARAAITSSSTGSVDASDIQLYIEDEINIKHSQIKSSAESSNAGSIEVLSKELFMESALITTSVTNDGNGGDIFVGSEFILMDSGFIQGNTGGSDFSGGNINIESDFLIVSNRSLITSSDERQAFVPNSGINVIQAAAPDGVSGDVNIGALEFDLSDELASIGGEVLNLDNLQSNPCDTSSGSALTNVGKGGQPALAGGFNAVSLEQTDIARRVSSNLSKKSEQRDHVASSFDYSGTCTKNQNTTGNITGNPSQHGAP